MKNLSGMCDFPGSPILHTIDLEFLNQNTHHRLTTTELSKNYSNWFQQKPTSVSIKP